MARDQRIGARLEGDADVTNRLIDQALAWLQARGKASRKRNRVLEMTIQNTEKPKGKARREVLHLAALCALLCVPLLFSAPIRDTGYRTACYFVPSLRKSLSQDLRMEVSVGGNLKKIRQLVARGADVNDTSFAGSALSDAVNGHRVDIALFLVQNGANPNYRSAPTDSTPFYEAVTNLDSAQLIKEMLQKGADIDGANGTDDNPILPEALRRNNQFARLLIEGGANVNTRSIISHDYADLTPLMRAVAHFSPQRVQMLLQRGAVVNAVITKPAQRKGTTALSYAVKRHNPEIVELLLDHGANPNLFPAKHYDDETDAPILLSLVQMHGEPDVLPQSQNKIFWALVNHGANVNVCDDHWSPLLCASSRFVPDIVQALLQRGAKVNWQSEDDGSSALMYAASVGDATTIKLLLRHGANPKMRDRDGRTALDWARDVNKIAVIRVLEDVTQPQKPKPRA